MQISIIRQEHKPWGIDGHLYINRQLICDTVEHPSNYLPQGDYPIAPTAIFTHGDGPLKLTNGQIIVGRKLMSGLVTDSLSTYHKLYERLKKARQRHTPIELKIFG